MILKFMVTIFIYTTLLIGSCWTTHKYIILSIQYSKWEYMLKSCNSSIRV